ncbi:MAG: MerR family DNA-binding transcriptional regulator [Planctomycetes bacterium]|nr:MerR family DNA-binding transcriptional regulator [Planctomycetota bacterium]
MDERNMAARLSSEPEAAASAAVTVGHITPPPITSSRERPQKLYKIGEVMRYSRLSRQTLHNYTMMGLIEESERTEAGHRLYPEAVFATLERIELLKRHRPLREVRAILEAERTTGVRA